MCKFMAKIIRGGKGRGRVVGSLTVIYVDIINHLPACVSAGSIISSTASTDQHSGSSNSSPSGLERFLVMALLECVTAKREGRGVN